MTMKSRCTTWVIVALSFLFFSTGVVAAGRVALVIGNAAYDEAPLKNPVNDARAMSAALRHLGFEVISMEEANHKQMQSAVVEFAERLSAGDTGLFYYAGHGIQVEGGNYLIPIDAQIKSEVTARFEAMAVEDILDVMERAGNKLNFVILDACRNNPFERKLRGQSRGLAAMDAAAGTLIAYATAPGSVAADGDGANGLYTESLLSALAIPGLKAEEVFKQVRIEVLQSSHGLQIPWESSSLTGEFIFNIQGNTTINVQTTATPEVVFWESIRDTDNLGNFRAYLAKYPDGIFSGLAAVRLGQPSVVSAQPAEEVSFAGKWKGEADALGGGKCNKLILSARIQGNTIETWFVLPTSYRGPGVGRGSGTIDANGILKVKFSALPEVGTISLKGTYQSPHLQGTLKSRNCEGKWWLARVEDE